MSDGTTPRGAARQRADRWLNRILPQSLDATWEKLASVAVNLGDRQPPPR